MCAAASRHVGVLACSCELSLSSSMSLPLCSSCLPIGVVTGMKFGRPLPSIRLSPQMWLGTLPFTHSVSPHGSLRRFMCRGPHICQPRCTHERHRGGVSSSMKCSMAIWKVSSTWCIAHLRSSARSCAMYHFMVPHPHYYSGSSHPRKPCRPDMPIG